MNTTIELSYDGIDYVLEYDRASVKMLESNGFKLDEFLEKPMTNIELVFQGSFIKNHPKTPITTISEILENCPDKTNLLLTLKQMIDSTYESLLAEPEKDKGDGKNVSWKTVDLSPKTVQK